jgi:hypothetical protein
MKIFLAIFVLLIGMSPVAPSYAHDDLTVLPMTPVAGHTQSEWSRIWWQWAGSFEMNESPIADRSGALCGSKQNGPVWFLAGTYGTHRTIRTCKVPRGKYLFFPLINSVVMPPVDRRVNCAAVTASAAAMTDHPSRLIVDVDGVRIRNLATYRQATNKCFDMGTRAEPKTRVFPSAANGYYVMLKPLSPGKHVLNFGGALPSMLQAVTYMLQVE